MTKSDCFNYGYECENRDCNECDHFEGIDPESYCDKCDTYECWDCWKEGDT